MGNERVRGAMLSAGYGAADLARAVGVDVKTVERWVNPGRTPYPRTAHLAASALGVPVASLWPSLLTPDDSPAGDEIHRVYLERAAVERETWLGLLDRAHEHIDVLVFSGTFLAQTNPRIAAMLGVCAERGAQVRLCFGDPDSDAVTRRGAEEGLGAALEAKVRASLTYFRELPGRDGCEVRLHDTTLYASLFRFDDDLLVNPHLWGRPASANPVLHVRKGGSLFAQYSESFDTVWATAAGWTPVTTG